MVTIQSFWRESCKTRRCSRMSWSAQLCCTLLWSQFSLLREDVGRGMIYRMLPTKPMGQGFRGQLKAWNMLEGCLENWLASSPRCIEHLLYVPHRIVHLKERNWALASCTHHPSNPSIDGSACSHDCSWTKTGQLPKRHCLVVVCLLAKLDFSRTSAAHARPS